VGLFGSLEEVNDYLRKYRASKKQLSKRPTAPYI
jgi:hypothetical protein